MTPMHHGAWGTEAEFCHGYPLLSISIKALMNFPEVKYEARVMHLQAAISPMAAPTLLGTELDPGLPLGR
ncbi:protein of unknown function [Agrobacterium pusense]|uniref:Uncharacterized protein n=1 Tax=Agrobacterium pusense TaxID=648995 RepID=U4PXR3_9HYPH|nr:protein of unknown function [Agrobacterium pusense]